MLGNAELNDTLGAVILAGGLARRMGGDDKGLIELHGRPMVSWVVEAIKPVANEVVINANRNTQAYGQLNLDVIGDVIGDFPGPLAGLLSACEHLTTDWVLMCPCDSPFIQRALIETLWQAAQSQAQSGDTSIVVAHDGERLQPVFAIVRRELKSSIRDFLTRGDRKIDRWYKEEGFTAVDCAGCASMFSNINTAEELEAAEQRLQQKKHRDKPLWQ